MVSITQLYESHAHHLCSEKMTNFLDPATETCTTFQESSNSSTIAISGNAKRSKVPNTHHWNRELPQSKMTQTINSQSHLASSSIIGHVFRTVGLKFRIVSMPLQAEEEEKRHLLVSETKRSSMTRAEMSVTTPPESVRL